MFTVKLREAERKLTYKEQLIAKYLINSQYDISALTSSSIAEILGIGQATVVRFSKKLGYASFKDMILDISESMTLDFESSEISQNEADTETIEKLRQLHISSLNEVAKLNDIQEIEEAAKTLEHARTIFCYGIMSSSAISSILYNRLSEIGLNAIQAENPFSAISIVRNLSEQDAMFIVSASGESPETVKVAQIAHKRGVKIISITGNHDNTIRSLATHALRCPESRIYANLFSITNRSSQIFLVDSLFMTIWKHHSAEYLDKIREINSEVSSIGTQREHYELFRL